MDGVPAQIPAPSHARLPAIYEAATAAIAECAQIDECKGWSDRMEALASYARQADDETLLKHAMRIKARAVERCGELLKDIPEASGKRTDIEPSAAADTRFGAAKDAGLSRRQAITAIRVANIPREEFERLVESDAPPTIEQLAERGTQKRQQPVTIDHLGGRDPADFRAATKLLEILWHVEREGIPIDIDAASRGLNDNERLRAELLINKVQSWAEDVGNAL